MTPLNPERANFITASEFGAILGLSPFLSGVEALCKKQAQNHNFEESDAMTCGKYLEPMLFRMSEIGFGGLKSANPVVPWPQEHMLTADLYPWASATPDARCGPQFWEFKTTSQKIDDLADVPSWHLQLVLQLMLGEANKLTGNTGELHVFHVPREMQAAVAIQARLGAPLGPTEALLGDFLRANYQRLPVAVSAQLAGYLDDVGTEIHRRFIVGKEKPESWDPPTQEVLRMLYPQDDGTVKALDLEAERIVVDLMAVKQTMKGLEEREETLRNQLIQTMGAASTGTLSDGRKVHYKAVHYGGYVKEVAPHDVRVLRLPQIKKSKGD